MLQGKGAGAPGMTGLKFSEEELDIVGKTRGVKEVSGMFFNVVKVSKNNNIKMIFANANDPKTDLMLETFNIDIYEGRKLERGDTSKVVLGYNYLTEDRIFKRPYKLNDKIEINGEKFKIVGFLEEIGNPQDDSTIYLTEEGFLKKK